VNVRGGALIVSCVLAVTASGCGATAHKRSSATIRPTATELLWRKRVARVAIGNPIVPARRVATLRRRLVTATVATTGGSLVRLRVRRAPEPAPELVIAADRPARFLKHALPRLLPLLRNDDSVYLAIVDRRSRLVLEWALNGGSNPNRGSLYVRPGLEHCSPIVAVGWPSRLARCPAA
jgi:hypothetical protein